MNLSLSLSPVHVIELDAAASWAASLKLAGPPIQSINLSPALSIEADLGRFVEQQKIIQVDGSRPIAYAGFASFIKRLDYSTWPPVITTAQTADLNTDWVNRQTLIYG
jgi:hypothetical protein